MITYKHYNSSLLFYEKKNHSKARNPSIVQLSKFINQKIYNLLTTLPTQDKMLQIHAYASFQRLTSGAISSVASSPGKARSSIWRGRETSKSGAAPLRRKVKLNFRVCAALASAVPRTRPNRARGALPFIAGSF